MLHIKFNKIVTQTTHILLCTSYNMKEGNIHGITCRCVTAFAKLEYRQKKMEKCLYAQKTCQSRALIYPFLKVQILGYFSIKY